MTQRRSKPLPPSMIDSDRMVLRALRLLPDYAPANRDLSKESLQAKDAALTAAEEREFQLEMELAAARSTRATLGWELHDAVLLAKAAVTSQYGSNSDAIASLGLKKKGEYRRPGRRNPPERAE